MDRVMFCLYDGCYVRLRAPARVIVANGEIWYYGVCPTCNGGLYAAPFAARNQNNNLRNTSRKAHGAAWSNYDNKCVDKARKKKQIDTIFFFYAGLVVPGNVEIKYEIIHSKKITIAVLSGPVKIISRSAMTTSNPVEIIPLYFPKKYIITQKICARNYYLRRREQHTQCGEWTEHEHQN